MTVSDQKEQFSIAYARAIAATAAVSVSVPEVDDDSIDLTMYQKGTGTVYPSPRLDVQLKCADETTLTKTGSHLHYPLKLKNYEELRLTELLVPRILVVITVPTQLTDWIYWTPQEMAVRRAGYWMSLRGLGSTGNAANVTVRVPLANEFTTKQLRSIMDRIGAGSNP